MLSIKVNDKSVAIRISVVNGKVLIAAQINNGWYPILGMNSLGEVWRYPGLPPNDVFKLNKEGKILECK
jgi:hypothetical protein